MPVCVERQFAFVHIPKCAGKSITTAICNNGIKLSHIGATTDEQRTKFGKNALWMHHLKASQLLLDVGTISWNKYFTFAFVRNPWDLMVSYYHYHKMETATSPGFRKEWPKIAERFDACRDFASWVKSGIYVEPQSLFVTTGEGQLLVDFIGRFEAIDRDFGLVARRLGINALLPHLNATAHGSYRRYYDIETRGLISQEFAEDIERFDYDF